MEGVIGDFHEQTIQWDQFISSELGIHRDGHGHEPNMEHAMSVIVSRGNQTIDAKDNTLESIEQQLLCTMGT